MNRANVFMLWRDPAVGMRFHTGVCLHGHTMHSEECLAFLPRHLHRVPAISQIVAHYEHRPAHAVDFSRAYWTPPLSPACTLHLERKQISNLGLQPLVSLTDHDNIEAGMALQVTSRPSEIPVSVEWTVPYERSILHLGCHNLPPTLARFWMSVLSAYTAAPAEHRLPGILRELSRVPGVLIVLNHPFWLEEGVTEPDHQRALGRALRECHEWFHAFELNGTRGWRENLAVIELARQWSRPLISGGDRHAGEPAACLNLTCSRTFAQFADEIRCGHSSVLFMPHYREPMPVRVLEAVWDILRPYPEYAGRERWTDRTFYRGKDGIARPLSSIWKDRVPWFLQPATNILQFFATRRIRGALRYLLAGQAGLLP
jgi:hypothetical protein